MASKKPKAKRTLPQAPGKEEGAKKRKAEYRPHINHAYTCDPFLCRLTECWRDSKPLKDGATELLSDPFQCCVLPEFVSDPSQFQCRPSTEGVGQAAPEREEEENGAEPAADVSTATAASFLSRLITELLRLKFYEKNNDLYQFHQSDDFKKFKTPCISALRSLFREQCLPWLRSVTGLQLTDAIDMTCSKYNYTDVLLCHDDELEGRRIAFIWYLVPEEWSQEDGGFLDLFATDTLGQPGEVVRRILPTRNTIIFFDVNAKSFHQVSEVLSVAKTRLSVNGWFHGPPSPRPPTYKPHPLTLSPPISLGLEYLSEWVEPMYLDVGVQKQIQQQFEADSQIQLPNFLLEERWRELSEELAGVGEEVWRAEGPPNRKHICVANHSSLPPLSRDFLRLLVSTPFLLLLAHMTELDLVEDVLKIVDGNDLKSAASAKIKRADSAELENADSAETENADSAFNPDLRSKALCRGDLFRWRHGDYTLAGDPCDPGMGVFALEADISFNCEEWCEEYGGSVSYIASDEDEELLTVCPSGNCLSLVYRDRDSLRFRKHINHRSHPYAFQTASATYLENTSNSSNS